jgi:hypothetical protein
MTKTLAQEKQARIYHLTGNAFVLEDWYLEVLEKEIQGSQELEKLTYILQEER